MIHVTGTAAINIPACAGIMITMNSAVTGTYTLVDGAGTTQAVITNPTVGGSFTYFGLISSAASPATLTASVTGDATINILNRTLI